MGVAPGDSSAQASEEILAKIKKKKVLLPSAHGGKNAETQFTVRRVSSCSYP